MSTAPNVIWDAPASRVKWDGEAEQKPPMGLWERLTQPGFLGRLKMAITPPPEPNLKGITEAQAAEGYSPYVDKLQRDIKTASTLANAAMMFSGDPQMGMPKANLPGLAADTASLASEAGGRMADAAGSVKDAIGRATRIPGRFRPNSAPGAPPTPGPLRPWVKAVTPAILGTTALRGAADAILPAHPEPIDLRIGLNERLATLPPWETSPRADYPAPIGPQENPPGWSVPIPNRMPRVVPPRENPLAVKPAPEPSVSVIPEPRAELAGDRPGAAWSLKRVQGKDLQEAAQRGLPGAGDVLSQQRPIIYEPREGTGYPAPRRLAIKPVEQPAEPAMPTAEEAQPLNKPIAAKVPTPKVAPLSQRYEPDVLEEANNQMRGALELADTLPTAGRYFNEVGQTDEPLAHLSRSDIKAGMRPGGTWTGIPSQKGNIGGQYPWFNDPEISPAKLRNAIQQGKGAAYERIVSKIADGIVKERGAATSAISEHIPELRQLSQQVQEIDPELSQTLSDLADGKIGLAPDKLKAYVTEKIADATSASQFSQAIDDAAAERGSSSVSQANPDVPATRSGSGEAGPATEATELTSKLPGITPEGVFPGMGDYVRAQQESAAQVRGQKLTEQFNRPPESIESAAGEMERSSPLFRGTAASPQSEMFGSQSARENIVSTPAAPKDFVIRPEPHPFKPGKSVYRAYYSDGRPTYLGGDTPEEVAAKLRENENVRNIRLPGINPER